MRLLFDTQILLWLIYEPERLSPIAKSLLNDPLNELFFSSVSIWEIAIKQGIGKLNFSAQATEVLAELSTRGFVEVPLMSPHGLATLHLAPIHRDPFDRILLAQGRHEQLTLVTADRMLASYPGAIVKV